MRYLLLALVAVQTLLSGCAGRGTRRSAPPRTVVEVDNQSFHDFTIYVLNGGQRLRVGFAPGLRKTELTIPPSMVSGSRQLAFVADPLGSNRASVSDQIYVAPGDHVTLTIPP
jgi:ABC-type taurine transport system ATPase subunit